MKDFLITPEEAVELFHHGDAGHCIMAVQIHNAYIKEDHNLRDAHIFAYGACFHAGVVEGVRRERAKRHKFKIRIVAVFDRQKPKSETTRECIIGILDKIHSEKTLTRICRFVELLYSKEG